MWAFFGQVQVEQMVKDGFLATTEGQQVKESIYSKQKKVSEHFI